MPPLRSLLLGVVLAALPVSLSALPLPPPLAPELISLAPAPLLGSAPFDAASARFADRTGASPAAGFTALASPASPAPAFRVTTSTRGRHAYDVEVGLPLVPALARGDVGLIRFMARAPVARQESGEGDLGVVLQRGSAPFEKSLSLSVGPGPEWALFEIPFTIAHDFAPGEAALVFNFAALAQTVEISGLEVLHFGRRARLDQLPRLALTYRGREAGAAWRAAALARIQEIRTAPLVIRVQDAAGRPLAGARVEAVLEDAGFVWGTAVDDRLIVADTPDAARYRGLIPEFFNTVVIENGLKWPTWNAGPARQADALRALDCIESNNLRHRGHNLVWPGWKFSPRGQRDLPDLATALPPLIEARITEMLAATRGRHIAWDVVNEPLHERDYFDHIPELAMAGWFKLARRLDPSADLYINDYSMLNSGLSPGTIARYRDLIGRLRRAGAPIDGIGIQGHIGRQPRAPELVLSDLDLIAAEGLPVQITEFDINTADESLQGDYTRDFLIACYSHPVVTGFVKWGFWQGRHWKPDAAMFRRDWSEKPNAAAWRDLVLGQWRTRIDENTTSDPSTSADTSAATASPSPATA
jgi:endo-1,4-beta-xylanase